MNRWTHFATGLLAGQLFFYKPPTYDNLSVLMTAVGSLLPDMDQRMGLGFGDDSSMIKHRGFTHTFLFAAVIYGLGYLLKPVAGRYFSIDFMHLIVIPLCCGILVHLFVDSMNTAGIQPFLPFSSVHIWLFATPWSGKKRINQTLGTTCWQDQLL